MAYQLCDAHAHIGTEWELKKWSLEAIPSLVCATTPMEAALLKEMYTFPASYITPTYGLHPWQGMQYSVTEMTPFFAECSIIGEIGMDSVWCKVPLSLQETIFKEQLAIAAILKKPVILHTKGQEKEIATIIKHYPNTYLVHWYSAPEFPDIYLESDCYFSIGPDVWWNEAVRQVATHIPKDRLLLETDGMEAVKWAWEEAPKGIKHPLLPAPPTTVKEALAASLFVTAALRGCSEDELGRQIEENFYRFTNKSNYLKTPQLPG